MAPDGTNSPKNELDEISNMSVSSFLTRCKKLKMELEHGISEGSTLGEVKNFLGLAGDALLGEHIRDVNIAPEQVLEIADVKVSFSQLLEKFSNADAESLGGVIDMALDEFISEMGNYSLEWLSKDIEYAQKVASIAIILQIVAYYPLVEPIEQIVEESKDDADDALKKKSYADLDLDELHMRFKVLTIEKRGKAIQVCVDRGWLTQKNADKIIIDEEKGYIGIYFSGREIEIAINDDQEGASFFETSTEDSPDSVDWEFVSRGFVSEIEVLRQEKKGQSMHTTKGDKRMLEIEGEIKELQKQRDIAVNFFARNVLNMRETEYLITRRGGAYIDPTRGTKEILPSSLHDKVQTVSFEDGFTINNKGLSKARQTTFLDPESKRGSVDPSHYGVYVEVQEGESFPIRRVRKAT